MSENVEANVKEYYGGIANEGPSHSGCAPGAVSEFEIKGLSKSDVYSLGCGIGGAHEAKMGETVLDLGSGTGMEALLSAERVGPSGKVYGLDMTDEMLQKSRKNASKAGAKNVEFLKGYIDDIPLPDDSIDLVISNCVINLAEYKSNVFREAFRVLKSGGRMIIQDIVSELNIPESVRNNEAAWACCVGGAVPKGDYIRMIKDAGFSDLETEITDRFEAFDQKMLSVRIIGNKA